MDAAPSNTVERILSRRSLVRGGVRIAGLWSITATGLLLLLLLDVNLLLGLLVDRGRVDLVLRPADVPQFEKLTGLHVPIAPLAKGEATDEEEVEAAPVPIFFEEHGILPAVWQTRDVWWGRTIAFLFRRVGWLQSNILALIWLLSAGVLLIVFRDFCLRQIRDRSNRSAIDAVTATRRNLHRQVLRLGPEDLDGAGHEIAIRLFTADVEVIRRGLYESISRIIRYPLELLGLSIVLLSLDWRLALQWIAPTTLVILLVDGVRKMAVHNQRLAEDHGREEEQRLLSSLRNSRLTRGLGLEESEYEQFQKHLDRYHTQLRKAARATDVVNFPQSKIVISCVALLGFLMFLVGGNVLTVGKLTSTHGMTAAEALTFIIAVAMAIPGVEALKTLSEFRHDLKLAASRIHRYLEQIPSVSQAVGAKFLQPMSKTLHFENVKYQTPEGRKILDGVDFKLQVDKTFAIVSVDPLEAKAIALMLPRFIEPREGRVMIDGEDIAWVTLESLRAETVLVTANDPPLDGTVFDNIRGGHQELSLQQVTEAAKMTHAHNFIVKLFNGYETMLASHGDSLDAGQLFRLNLARAIACDPALLIIEEPTATLDEDTKTLLIDAYDRICRGRTVIFLPARMSTVRRTDQIVVLYEGKVAALGPHAKLVTQSAVYRHWEYLRFNEFRHDSHDGQA